MLASAREEVDRLTAIVRDLLTLARADEGQLAPGRDVLDLRELARAAAAGPAAPDVRLDVAGEPALVVGDRDALQRALANLVENAIKASPPGEVVTLTTWSERGTAGVTVADRGPGVPEDARERIFEPLRPPRRGARPRRRQRARPRHLPRARAGPRRRGDAGRRPGRRRVLDPPARRALTLGPHALAARPVDAREDRDPQPRRARAARGHRQLVRAPAGQALRGRAGRLGDDLELRHPLRQPQDARGAARRPPGRARSTGRWRSSCSARTRRSCAPRRRRWRAWAPTCMDLNMGCPVPKVTKTGAGVALISRPGPGGGDRPRRPRGLRPPGHGQAARGAEARRARGARAWRGGSWRRPASPASVPPARRGGPPPRHAGLRPGEAAGRGAARAGDRLRRHAGRRARPLGVRAHRLRGGHAGPRRAGQPVAVRPGPGRARRTSPRRTRSSRSGPGWSTAPRSTSDRTGRPATCASSTPGTRSGSMRRKALRKRCSARSRLHEQREVLAALTPLAA